MPATPDATGRRHGRGVERRRSRLSGAPRLDPGATTRRPSRTPPGEHVEPDSRDGCERRRCRRTPAAREAAAPLAPPADPLGAAIAARLADPAPLLARLTTKDREAMQAFYALGAFKPVWIVEGAFTPAAKAVIARLAQPARTGSIRSAYPVPSSGTARADRRRGRRGRPEALRGRGPLCARRPRRSHQSRRRCRA